jgi:hypothetical protein
VPDIAIARMFRDFGIATPGAQKTAREALSRAGIISSRPNRTAIASEKVDRAREALETAFLWHCGNGDCRRQAEASRSLLVDQAHCTICGGSKDRSSLEAMASALVASNVSKVLVVGGTEAKCREIREKSPPGIEWRFVDGTKSKDDRYFRPARRWADIIVIWGSTVLDHRVSSHFEAKGDARVITVTRRSIGALAEAVVEHLKRR